MRELIGENEVREGEVERVFIQGRGSGKGREREKSIYCSDRGTQYVVLIMEMPLKTELWKLSLHNLSLKNMRIE